MRLTVTYPTDEFECDEYPDGDHTRETADAHLATMPRGWLEATLADDGEVAWRRFPSSSWVAVKHWPLRPTERDREVTVDMEALESWLRAIGVRVRWDVLKRHPFPGHAVNRDALEPDHYARVSQRKGRSAIHAVLSSLIGEGMDYGEALHLMRSGCEHRREDRARYAAMQDAEMLRLRNEVRRLKGEPELTEEQERNEGRESVRKWVAETLARRKSSQWGASPQRPEVIDHHRAHADADGRSWWAVRRPTCDLIAADATGYVYVTAHDCGVYAFAAGDGTPTIAGKSDATMWSEWSPVAGWYGAHVEWPAARPVGAPELSGEGVAP